MRSKVHIFMLLLCSLVLFSCQPVDLDKELRLGIAAAKNNDWEKALAKAELCLDNVPSSADAAILKSLSLFLLHYNNAEDVEKALELIRQVTKEHPDRYDAFLVHGWILMNKNRLDEAIMPLKRAYELQLDPSNKNVTQVVQGTINYALGITYLRNNIFEDAEKHLLTAIKSTPYNEWYSIYASLGVIAYNRGQYRKALDYMVKARELAPKDEYAIAVNIAVLMDYLSYRKFNPSNPKVYAAQRQNWYRYALNCVLMARNSSINLKEQRYLDELAKSIRKRARI